MQTQATTQTKTAASSVLNSDRSGILQRKCTECEQHTIGGGSCGKCQKQRSQLAASYQNQKVPQIVHNVLSSVGQPLDPSTRNFMESKFAHDFSKVRIHNNSEAATSAHAVNALAYTVGNQIVFDTGKFAPHTLSGSYLIAHELAHVIQQEQATVHDLQKLSISSQNDIYEQEAESAAKQVVGNEPRQDSIFINNYAHQHIIQRACSTDVESLNCTLSNDSSILKLNRTTGESTFLFNEDCEFSENYAEDLSRFAQSISNSEIIEIHGFSSYEEYVDYSCQRAVTAKDILLSNGLDSSQISGLYAHSAVPGGGFENRSVVIHTIGTKASEIQTETSNQEDTKKPIKEIISREGVSSEFTGANWKSIDQIGIVRVDEPGESVRGARLRPEASTNKKELYHLNENTKVQILAENKKDKWLYVKVLEKPFQGSVGYVSTALIWRNLPDPDAVLYYVKPGEKLQYIAENHQQYRDYDIRTGDDARSIVMAIYVANNADVATKGRVYLNQEKLQQAQDPSFSEGFKDKLDEYRRILRPIFQSAEVQAQTTIWLPGKSYVTDLQKRGIIPKRAEWKNKAIATTKGIKGFADGLIDGLGSSIRDVFKEVIDLIESIIATAISLLSGEAIQSAQEIYDVISNISASELLEILVNALSGFADELFSNFINNWNANSPYHRWYFRGKIIGYILAEVLMLIFSGGASAVKWLGKLGKIGAKLAKVLGKVLDKVEDLRSVGKLSKKKVSNSDIIAPPQQGSQESKEWAIALGLARSIVELHDEKNTPTSIMKTSLVPLQKKFKWIKKFETKEKSPNHYQILMIGSKYIVKDDYDITQQQGLGEELIKEDERLNLNVDLAVQEHKDKTKFRSGSGKEVESAHLVPSAVVRDLENYSRSSAVTTLLPKKHHRQFDDFWKQWAREQLKKGVTEVKVKDFIKVLDQAAESVPELRGRTADTMQWLFRKEFYQDLRLSPDDVLRMPFSP